MERTCAVCGVIASKNCSGCHSVFYCSVEHQGLGWKQGHAKACVPRGVPSRADTTYTKCYCEENALLLLEKVNRVDASWAVFVSNPRKTVAMWGHAAERRAIVWDYHVVAAFASDDRTTIWVCDADAKALPWPARLDDWLASSFPQQSCNNPNQLPWFRVVDLKTLSQEFCSDRSHMKSSGMRPPPYPPIIRRPGATTNLFSSFVSMEPTQGFGVVCPDQDALKAFFRATTPTNAPPPPFERAFPNLGVVVRSAGLPDLEGLFALERAEGWSAPDAAQAPVYFNLDHTGWLKATLGSTTIGFISILKYQRWAYLSSFIVAKEQRGKRIGEALWKCGIDRLPENLVCVLDAVQFSRPVEGELVDMVPTYAKQVPHFGFSPLFTWHNFFLEPFVRNHVVAPVGVGIMVAEDRHMEGVKALHRRGFGADLGTFMDNWRAVPGSVMVVAERSSSIIGVIAARPMANGSYKMGPFFVDPEYGTDESLIDAMVDALAVALGGSVPKMACFAAVDRNEWARAWLQRGGWRPTYRNCVRMVRWPANKSHPDMTSFGPVMGHDMRMVFAVTSLKLG